MINFENTEVLGWEHAIRGMRNPMNSWDKRDSQYCSDYTSCGDCPVFNLNGYGECGKEDGNVSNKTYVIGLNDYNLMMKLQNSGTDHRKFMRMITVYVDITAPLYWWKEFDTYKVGTVANSCSTMHKIAAKEFTLDDFSCEHLLDTTVKETKTDEFMQNYTVDNYDENWKRDMDFIIGRLNYARKRFIETQDKKYWWQMIQLLPTSYNQKRTVMLNYEVLANIYKSRKNHKLDEWCEHKKKPIDNIKVGDFKPSYTVTYTYDFGFCDWIKKLPYSELITGETEGDEK